MQKVRHRIAVRVGALAAIVALVGLSAVGAGSARPSGGAKRSASTIVIGLPGIPPIFLGVRPYVALQDGFYKKYGADVQLKQFTTGTDALRAVQAGQIDLAWAPTPTALALMSRGAPLVGIEGMDVIDWLVGSVDPNVKTCSDLKGQTIGVDAVGGARYTALQAMLTKCKLDIKDVKTVNFPGNACSQAMIAGQQKVCVLHIDDLAQIEYTSKKKVYVNVRLTDVDPYQHYDLLVSTREGVKNHYYDYVHILAGDIAATRYMYNPKNVSNVAKIAMVTGISKAIAVQTLKRYFAMKWWPLDKSGLGKSRITRTIGLNVKLGNIKADANLQWKDVVDTRMWKAAFKLVNKNKR